MVKKVSVHEFTGAVNVNGDITPITRQPVDKIDAGNWSKMTVSDLHKQREILQTRYYRALNAGLGTGANTIQQGINQIDFLLENIGEEPIGFL